MQQKGFTLVELLVVVTIIAIVGITSISGFSHLSETEDAHSIRTDILNSLSDLDRAIEKHEISSYEATIESGSLGYITTQDFYRKPVMMFLKNFDFGAGTGTVKNTSTSTGIWQIGVQKGMSVDERGQTTASGGTLDFSFSGGTHTDQYTLVSIIDSKRLNSLVFHYFDVENFGWVPEKQVRLVSITSSGTPYSWLTIRNILGKKELYGSGASLTPLTSATLTFEKNGKEIIVNIRK